MDNKATEIFEKGFNCAQSMLYAQGKEFFKDESQALKLASAFGAGISFRGEMCGAVSGALMLIGLKYGFSDPKDELSREKTYMLVKEFTKEFEKQNGSVICNKILDTDMSTPEGVDFARQNNLFKTLCPKMVESSSKILSELFEKYPFKES
jgi:C_GCAxxG_C_C family probable redox protein